MDTDVEEWLAWQHDSAHDDDASLTALRPRSGARWVPVFADYIDKHVTRFALSLGDGSVRWWRHDVDECEPAAAAAAAADAAHCADHVVVGVGFRSCGGDPTASSVWDG